MKPIILIGGGGHCISCIDVIEQAAEYVIVGIIDKAEKVGQSVLAYPIIGSDDDIAKFAENTPNFLITVGQVKSATLRKMLFRRAVQAGCSLPPIVSPSAYVSRHAKIGEGSIIMHHAVVNAGARIGRNCIVNTRALIEHEVTIGDHCHVSTGAVINGQVVIGDETFVGSQATVGNNLSIGSNTVIGAASLILKDLSGGGTYVGKVV